MISTRTGTARKIGCSADHRGHLVGEGKFANGGRPGALRMAGDSCPRQALVSGSGPAEEPGQCKVSIAQFVRSVIGQGV